jgi:hypothetical protein
MSTMDFSKYLPTPTYSQKEYEYDSVSNSNYMWNELWSTYYELIDTISNNIKKQLDDINQQIETPDDAKLISMKNELEQELCELNREHKGIIIEPYWGLKDAIFFIKQLRFASSEE